MNFCMKYIVFNFLSLILLFIHPKAFGQLHFGQNYDYECIWSDVPCNDSTAITTCDDCHNNLSDNTQEILKTNCEAWMNDPICTDVPGDKKIDCQNLREYKPSVMNSYTITHINTSPFIDRFNVDLKNNPPVKFEKINDPRRTIRSALDPPNFLDIAQNCGSGVSAAIYNMVNFFRESVTSKYNFATNVDYREETINETLEYINQTKLYFKTEYTRNYEKASVLEQLMQLTPNVPDPILMRTGWAIGIEILNKVSQLIREEIERTQCMNTQAQAEIICNLLADIFIPPISAIALLKYGKSAIRAFPNLQRAFPKLHRSQNIFNTEKVESILGKTLTEKERQAIRQVHEINRRQPRQDSNPTERRNYIKNQRREQARILEEAGFSRTQRAEIMLGRSLSDQQKQAIIRAHEVGRGQPGKDGTLARAGNYTEAQLQEKIRILDEAGIKNSFERRILVEANIVGDINELEIQKFFLAQTLRITEEDDITALLPSVEHNEVADFFQERLGLSPYAVQQVLNEADGINEIDRDIIRNTRRSIENYMKKESLKKSLNITTNQGLRESLRDDLGRREVNNIDRFIAGENPSEAIEKFMRRTRNNQRKKTLKESLNITTDSALRAKLVAMLPRDERENIDKFINGEDPSRAIENVLENKGRYMPNNNADRAERVREAVTTELTEDRVRITADRLNNMPQTELQNSIQTHLRVNDRFMQILNDPQRVPRNVKNLFIRMIARLEEEGWEKTIQYPGLDFTQLRSTRYHRMKLGDHYRLIFTKNGDEYTLSRIMSHEEYNTFIKRLK